LRSEHETSTLSARLQAESFGAVFFGEIERSVLVEEKVLDEWKNAKEIQNSFATNTTQQGGNGQQQQQQQGGGLMGVESFSPVEGRPAQLGSLKGNNNHEGEAVFTGGIEYLKQFNGKEVRSD
jgi:hypothetical protein